MANKKPQIEFTVCINNEGYSTSLEVRKIYQLIPDPEAQVHKLVRVVDESGEDYLYPQSYFVPIKLPVEASKIFSSAEG